MARFRRALLLVEKERQAEREGQPIRYIRPHPETQRLQIDNAEWKRRERLEDAKELVEECGLSSPLFSKSNAIGPGRSDQWRECPNWPTETTSRHRLGFTAVMSS